MLIHHPNNKELIWHIIRRDWADIALLFADKTLHRLYIESPLTQQNHIDNIYWGRCIAHQPQKRCSLYDVGLDKPVLVNKDTKQHVGAYDMLQITRNVFGSKGMAGKKQIHLYSRFHQAKINQESYEIERNNIEYSNDDRLLDNDKSALEKNCDDIIKQIKNTKKPCLLYQSDCLIDTIKRQIPNNCAWVEYDKIIDDHIIETLESIFCSHIDIDQQRNISFHHNDALWAIDVNIGDVMQKPKSDLRPVLSTIGNHIMWRQCGGLIVIDCPDFAFKRHQQKQLCQFLRSHFKQHHISGDILGMSAAGLIEITRPRHSPSWQEMLSIDIDGVTYPYLHWYIWQILEKIDNMIHHPPVPANITITANHIVIKLLEKQYADYITKLEQRLKINIDYQIMSCRYDEIKI